MKACRTAATVGMVMMVATMIPAANFAKSKQPHPPGAFYFGSFGGYQLPLRPVEEISREEAESRTTYCIVRFDSSGLVVQIAKYLDGAPFFRHEYKYDESGRLAESRVWNAEGNLTIQYFDADGRVRP
jgi:hypothetical protein